MTDDIEERAALARRGIMDHSDCEECTEDWTFLMRQGRREFPLGLRTVLACLAFAEREGMAGKGGKHRGQPGVIHEVHRRRGPVAS